MEVSCPRDKAIERLGHAITSDLAALLARDSSEPSLAGTVSDDHVWLHKATFLYVNIYKPIFVGEFVTNGNKVMLIGKFRMGPTARITTWIFVTFLLLTQLLLLPLIGSDTWANSLQFLDPSLFIALVLAVVYSGKLIGRNDIPSIENKINQALLEKHTGI